MPWFDVCFFFFHLLIVVAKLELFVEGGELRQGALVGFYLDFYEKEEKVLKEKVQNIKGAQLPPSLWSSFSLSNLCLRLDFSGD